MKLIPRPAVLVALFALVVLASAVVVRATAPSAAAAADERYDEAAGRAVTGRGDLPVGGSVKRQASCSTARAACAAWTAA
jgi:hypothetical protein